MQTSLISPEWQKITVIYVVVTQFSEQNSEQIQAFQQVLNFHAVNFDKVKLCIIQTFCLM